MPTGTIILLGAFAGLTIYLGLPIAFLKQTPQSLKVFLNMLATGVLIFLLFDVVSKASDPINAALDQVRTQHTGAGLFYLDACLFVFGIGLGSVGLVYFNRSVFGRLRANTAGPLVAVADASPLQGASASVRAVPERREMSSSAVALLISAGIGLHKFSEGLTIGHLGPFAWLQITIW